MTTEDVPRSAVVLAGGRSRRFGRGDKALAPVAGRPMIRRVVERLAPATDEVVVNCRADQHPRLAAALGPAGEHVRFAIDAPDRVDDGPVAGLHAGLDAAASSLAAVVACDMPRLSPSLLDLLFVRASTEGRSVAVPTAGGHRQPLPGVVRVAPALAACEAVGPGGSLRALCDRLDPVVVSTAAVRGHAAPGTLVDVDTPADLRATAAAIDRT
ncbi:molybdenum cofactor guanylyltransferase [Halomarina ordinaria]|uniref:Probable molybdenum cofactor guanylyltransferase n=1 Tax=Halomarina ordinaria TaxID=3033939 RepID=A0ABD5U8A8_9EURY|nr:molybdenum cofactor guanylyltransferase [Halomarina sp. PSRA2]